MTETMNYSTEVNLNEDSETPLVDCPNKPIVFKRSLITCQEEDASMIGQDKTNTLNSQQM